MSISTTELLIICAFFLILALLHYQRRPKSAEDAEALRALIRNEVAQLDAETQRKMLREFHSALEQESATPSLTNWPPKS